VLPEQRQPAPFPRRVIWRSCFVVTIYIALLIIGQCASRFANNRRLTGAAIQHFHQELNNGQYHQIFNEADPGFVEGKREEDLVNFLQIIHIRFGDAGAVDLTGISTNATTNGVFTTVQCKTAFARGSALETFTWKEVGTTLRLYGYNVR
jgi:hypothetical protein